jgi:branched-chain amino acid transport system substrate-binding protein
MKYFKTLTLLFICFGIAVSFNSCKKDGTGPIEIGVLLPLTGAQANFGEMEKNSFEMAIEEINKAGGINGRMLEFIYEDDTGRPDVGRAGTEKLISFNKVPLLTGGYSSSVTFAAAAVAQQNRIPFLVNTGSVDKITQPEAFNLTTEDGDDFYIYRLNPPVSEYASGLESMLAEVIKPSTVYIIHENTTFGTKGAKAFQKSCDKLGFKVLGTDSYTSGTLDFKPLLLSAQNSKPDILYMISYVMDAALLMKQSRDIKFYPKMFVGAGAGFTMPAFKENAGKASALVVSTTLWHQTLPLKGALKYYDEYITKYGGDGPDYHGAEAYASAYVIENVLKRCNGKYDRETVKKALDETDMMTLFGPVKFQAYDNKIHQNKIKTYVVQWIEGELKLIWPKDLSNAEIQYPINWAEIWAD